MMKKIDLGEFFTILSNIGVIVGLVFVALEVKESRTASELTMISDVQDAWSQLTDVLLRDTEASRVLMKCMYEPDSLTSPEAARCTAFFLTLSDLMEKEWFYQERGLLPDDFWQDHMANFTGILQTPGGKQFRAANPWMDDWWLEDMQPFLGEEYKLNWLFVLRAG